MSKTLIVGGAIALGLGALYLYSNKKTVTPTPGNTGVVGPGNLIPTIHLIDNANGGTDAVFTDSNGDIVTTVPVFNNPNGSVTIDTGLAPAAHLSTVDIGSRRAYRGRPRVGLAMKCECAGGGECQTNDSTCACCTRNKVTVLPARKSPYGVPVANFARGKVLVG